MENEIQYGQMNFNLPHDVVPLPSQGLFYANKKKSVKVGYLTAQDENLKNISDDKESSSQFFKDLGHDLTDAEGKFILFLRLFPPQFLP